MGATRDTVNAVLNALTASDELAAWGREHYTRPVSFYVGIRDEKPIPVDDYPVVVIADATRTHGNDGSRNNGVRLGIGCGVMDDTSTTDSAKRTTVFNGMLLAEDLRDLVCDVIEKAGLGRPQFNSQPQQMSFFPAFVSLFFVTLQYRNVKRRLRP